MIPPSAWSLPLRPLDDALPEFLCLVSEHLRLPADEIVTLPAAAWFAAAFY